MTTQVPLPGQVTPLYNSHSSLPRITTSGHPRSAPPKPKVHLRNYIFILRPQLTGHQLQLYQRQHACVMSKPSPRSSFLPRVPQVPLRDGEGALLRTCLFGP